MNVLHFVPTLPSRAGGPSRSVPELCVALAAAGCQVQLTSRRVRGPTAPALAEAREAGVQIGLLGSRELPRDLWRRVQRADLVHLHSVWNPSAHLCARMARWAGKPLVVSPRGMLEPWALAKGRLKKRTAWHLYLHRDLQAAALLHATAASEQEQFRRLGLRTPTVVIPNGVRPPSLVACRPGARPYALFLSRVHPKKGLDLLVQAVDSLKAELRRTDWTIKIAGPDFGGHTAEVRRMVESRRLNDLFEFLPEVDGVDKWQLLAGASLMVLPSYSENFGICVAEALAVGTPALTTTATPWEELRTEDCGFWVPPTVAGISSGLAEAMKLSSEARRASGARGKALVERRYLWPSVGLSMLKAYEGIG